MRGCRSHSAPHEGTRSPAAACAASLAPRPRAPEQASLPASFTWKRVCLEAEGAGRSPRLASSKLGYAFPDTACLHSSGKGMLLRVRKCPLWRGSCVRGRGEDNRRWLFFCTSLLLWLYEALVWNYLWVYFASPTRWGAGADPSYCYK